jgi:hypothetical protein
MKRFWLPALIATVAACTPELDDRPFSIERERLIAVLLEPPELRPGAELRVTPVLAGRQRGSTTPSYHFCAAPPPPADPRSIAEACLTDTRLSLSLEGESARGDVPPEACARFGPDPTGSDFRPRDPDETGGFYQPLVSLGFGEPSVAELRLLCPLPDVPIDLSRAYSERYQPNHNPEGLRLEQAQGEEWHPLSSARGGERLRIRVAWSESARERFVWLSADGAALVDRIEAFRVAWFVTDGNVDQAGTAVSESEPDNQSENTFEAPEQAGTVQLWAVVHDSRGGTAAVSGVLDVEGQHEP